MRFVVRKRETAVAALTLSADAAAAWISKWQKTARGGLWIVSEPNGLTLRSIVLDRWLIKITWDAHQITVSQHGGIFVYEFRGFDTALVFLDALLLHHVIVHEERFGRRQLPTPAFILSREEHEVT